jgi:hypothetical protein
MHGVGDDDVPFCFVHLSVGWFCGEFNIVICRTDASTALTVCCAGGEREYFRLITRL